MGKERKERKFSLPIRLLAAFSLVLVFGCVVAALFVGINMVIGGILLVAALGVLGPAATAESANGLLGVVSSVFELITEGIGVVLELIGSLFSFGG